MSGGMADILLIKTSSLGDVVHQMPAVTDARRARPDLHLTWVVEDAFAPLARLHPGVDEVLPVSFRRWRKTLAVPSAWNNSMREIRLFMGRLRGRRYDIVLDTQGLVRTGMMARAARGERHGYDSASIREPAAAWFYDCRHAVGRNLHAVTRNRILTGLALGYAPQERLDYGLARAAPEGVEPLAILFHATSRADKEWPEAHWLALGRELRARGYRLLLPWGNARERERSQRLAAGLPGASVPEAMPVDAVARLIATAALVVGVDTGLLHLAAAYGVPLVAIFTASEPGLTGPVGAGPIAIVGSRGVVPPAAEVIAALPPPPH